jgi:hypothetical protein
VLGKFTLKRPVNRFAFVHNAVTVCINIGWLAGARWPGMHALYRADTFLAKRAGDFEPAATDTVVAIAQCSLNYLCRFRFSHLSIPNLAVVLSVSYAYIISPIMLLDNAKRHTRKNQDEHEYDQYPEH